MSVNRAFKVKQYSGVNFKKKIFYSDVISVENLKKGYDRIKRYNFMAAESFKNFGSKDFDTLFFSLKTQQYKPSIVKVINLNIDSGLKRGIYTCKDQVVLAALYNQLVEVLEFKLSSHSYGIRSKNNIHAMFQNLKIGWQNVNWIITFECETLWNSVNHLLLISILRSYCDQATLELIYKMLQVPYRSQEICGGGSKKLKSGLLHGSILSCILFNIYLTNFDYYIEDLEKNIIFSKIANDNLAFDKIKNFSIFLYIQKNNKYNHSFYTSKLIYTKKRFGKSRIVNFFTGIGTVCQKSQNRVYYIRWLDKIIIGVYGTKKEALFVSNIIFSYFENNLCKISKNANCLQHKSEANIEFIKLQILWVKVSNSLYNKDINRIQNYKVVFNAPVITLLKNGVYFGFGKVGKFGKIRATSFRRWAFLSDKEIIQNFSKLLKGIFFYYQVINSKSKIWPIFNFYRKSCALTLADKYRLRSAASVFKKFGPALTIKNDQGKKMCSLFYPKTLKTKVVFIKEKKEFQPRLKEDFVL